MRPQQIGRIAVRAAVWRTCGGPTRAGCSFGYANRLRKLEESRPGTQGASKDVRRGVLDDLRRQPQREVYLRLTAPASMNLD